MTQVEPPTESPQITSTQTSKSTVLAQGKRRHLLIPGILLALVFVAGLLGFFHFSSQPRTPLTLAMVSTLSGPNQYIGQEALQAVRLYVDQVNQEGGVNGHPIQLQVFDDKFDLKTAQQVARQVTASPSLMALGPVWSQMSLIPNPIYKAAQMPLLSATISTDNWTRQNPFAFRLKTALSTQSVLSATYVRQILGLRTATIVYANDPAYGVPSKNVFFDSFVQQGGHIAQSLEFDASHYKPSDLDHIANVILHDQSSPQIIYIAGVDVATADVVKALRHAGIKTPLFVTTTSSTTHFVDLFASEPEGFTDGIYAPAPVILDSAPDEAQAFASLYQHTYGHAPSWFSTMFYEAAQVALAALQAANVQGTPGSVKRDRALIAHQLNGMSSPQTSVEGINGPAYFDRGHNAILPSRVGQFLQGQLHSLPIQLQEVNTLDQVDLKNLENTGEIIQAEDPTSHQRYVLLKQHVVYAGIDLNKVTSINLSSSTFTADFYLWMRFTGSEDATAITFTTASNVSFDPTTPLKKETIGGLNYRLYHLTGDFKANYDLHEYPFDQQHLTIAFQNARLTNDRLVYVIDEQGLRLRPDNTSDPTTMAAVFQALSSWTYVSTQYASDTFTSHSTLGDPRNFGQRTQTAYSGLQVTTTLQRKSLSYLTSHLVPLLLLFLLVYASLFLHIRHLGDRLALIVTSLLASAVLLLSLNSELPEIGYTVSLDYIYYVFFGLCLVCIGITLLMEWLEQHGKHAKMVGRCNVFLHIIYLPIVTLTITYYVVIYHGRLA